MTKRELIVAVENELLRVVALSRKPASREKSRKLAILDIASFRNLNSTSPKEQLKRMERRFLWLSLTHVMQRVPLLELLRTLDPKRAERLIADGSV